MEPVEEGTTEIQRRQFQRRARKALATICLSLGDEQLALVRSAKTSKEAWSKLESHYEVKSLANKLFLRKKYFTITMAENDTMMEHVNKLKALAEQLEAIGAAVSEDDQVATLLCSLPDSYNNLIMALESRTDDLKLEFVIARLLHEEHKRKENSLPVDNTEKALFTSKGKQHEKPKGKKKGNCYNCGSPGHWARDCRKPKKAKPEGKQANASCMTECSETGEHTLFWSSEHTNNSSTTWYIDSGASQHMSHQKDSMEDYVEFATPEKVRLGDNRVIEALGKGSVWVQVKVEENYKRAKLQDVLYVPDLAKNLFSVSAVTKKKYSMSFDQEKCVIVDKNGNVVGSGKVCDNLFVLDVPQMKKKSHDVNAASELSEASSEHLWHQRYGHLGLKNLRMLRDKELVQGLKFQSSQESTFCDGCAKGKQKRMPFPKESSRATEILEIVHSDVCGPMQTKSHGGNRYFVTFIDDKSRFTAVYFMQRKDQVFEKFKEYEAMVTNVTGKNIKILRSDNGGEYTSKVFVDYLRKKGIQRQLTIPRTPQQNGVAERMNRTIQEAARSMMHNAGLEYGFWGEAVETAVILRNRSPTVAVENMTPYENFMGKKPDVSNLKVFGCNAYMHIAKETRKKWDPKSKKCIFIGYSLYSKAYRLWDPKARKVHLSRDVLFEENNFDGRVREPPYTESLELAGDNQEQAMVEELPEDPVEQQSVITQNRAEESNQQEPDNQTMADLPEEPVIEDPESVITNDDAEEETEVQETDNNRESEQLSRRSERNRMPPNRDGVITGDWWKRDATCSSAEGISEEPTTLEAALTSPDKVQWKEALDNEYSSLVKNNTWTLVPLPKGRKAVDCRWVFKVKYNADGSIERHKARLVAKGFSQVAGLDYEETFSPVARYTSIRTILAIANQLNLEVHQMDVSTAFLNGELQEEIYMTQPEGYILKRKEHLVCKLNKSIYGLKQASRCWFNTINEFLKNSGYVQCKSDPCLYIKREGDNLMLVALYVDDLLLASNSKKMLHREKEALKRRFEMKDLGEVHYCLGIQIERKRTKKFMLLHQSKYLTSLLKKFGMEDCKPVSTPLDQSSKLLPNEGDPVDKTKYQTLVGGLTYAVTGTRPDLAYALGMVSQFCSNPGLEHWKAAKRILRYIKGTIDYGIKFDGSKQDAVQVSGFVDADWGSNPNGRRSQSGYLFSLCGGIISWASKRQSTVALSSTEAEYVSASLACQEAVWLRALLDDLNFVQEESTVIKEDNQGAIALSKNPKFHARTKHIDIKHHFIRQKVDNAEITLEYCPTEQMLADLLTKALGKTLFQRFRDLMGMSNVI